MKTWRYASMVLLAGLLGAALLAPVAAEEKSKKEKQNDVNDLIFKKIALAGETADFGRKEKAPEALITAGSLLLQVQALSEGKLAKFKETPVDDKGEKLDVAAEKEKGFKEQAEELFDDAITLDEKVQGLVKAAKARKYEIDDTTGRDVIGGPRKVSRKIQAGGLHVYKFQFRSGRPAGVFMQSNIPVRFVIHQPGFGDLANEVVTSGQYVWTPKGKGPVEIHVRFQALARPVTYTCLVR